MHKEKFLEILKEKIGYFEIIECDDCTYIIIDNSFLLKIYDRGSGYICMYMNTILKLNNIDCYDFLQMIQSKNEIYKYILNYNDINNMKKFLEEQTGMKFNYKNNCYINENYTIKIDENGFFHFINENNEEYNEKYLDFDIFYNDGYKNFENNSNLNLNVNLSSLKDDDGKEIFNVICKNKNSDLYKFIKNDIEVIKKNCNLLSDPYVYFRNNKFDIYFRSLTLGNFNVICDDSCDLEGFNYIEIYFDKSGKFINGVTYVGDGIFATTIDDFKNNVVNISFLSWLSEKCNISYDIYYNNKREYKNEDYNNIYSREYNFYIGISPDTSNPSSNKDIQKLYNDFMNGNYDLDKILPIY